MLTTDIQLFQMFLQAGATGIALALVYLLKGNLKDNKKERESFLQVIKNHLEHANEIQKEANDVNKELSARFQELTDVICELKRVTYSTRRRKNA